jgi:isopenicillin N synthase-like dioxygenase
MNVLSVDYRSPDAPKLFAKSLHETGFGVLKNHPITHHLIADTFQDWEDFFALPTDEKMKYKYDPKLQSGYFPFRTENAKGFSKKDLKEFYHLYVWDKLPESVPNRTWEMFHAMSKLATQLLNWIEDESPAEVKKGFSMPLSDMIVDSKEVLLRPIHYPPLQGAEEEGAIRAAAHEDINLITLLPAATAPGLQVKDKNGKWLDVPCDPGQIIINSGDMLQMASNGYYISTTHQVVNPMGPAAKLPRFSMPLFLHPRGNVRLGEKHTARSYLEERLREIGLLKEGQGKA